MRFLKLLCVMRRRNTRFPHPELVCEGQEAIWPCALVWPIFQGATTLIGMSWYRRARLSTDPEQRLRQLWKKEKVLSTDQWINNNNEKEKTQGPGETKERGRWLSQGGEGSLEESEGGELLARVLGGTRDSRTYPRWASGEEGHCKTRVA